MQLYLDYQNHSPMSRTYLIAAFLFTFLFLRAQVQISEIEEIVKNDVYTKQFANVDGEDYLIEDNDEFTKISKISEDALQLIHKLNFRPFGQYRRNFYNYVCKSNDALLFQNKYLIQLYSQSIYLIDIVSGELYKKFESFDGSEINLASNNVISDNKIVLQLSKNDGSFSNVSLNLETSEIKQIDFEFNNHTFFIDGYYYIFKKNKLSRYNISTAVSEDLMSYDSLSGDIKFYFVDCSMRLCFNVDSQYYYLNEHHEIVSISCNIPDNIRTAYVKNDIMAFNYREHNVSYTKILNLSDCSTIFDSLELKDVHFFNLDNMNDDYLMATYSSSNGLSFANHYLINTSKKEINIINSSAVHLNHYDSYVYNDKIYISGWLGGNIVDLHRIDLSNETSQIATPYGSLQGTNIQLGKSSKEGIYYFVAASLFGDSELYKIQNDSIEKIYTFDTRQNLGISDIRNTVPYKNNFYYATLNGIYSSNANGTSKITSIVESTDLVRHGSFIYSMVKKAQNEIGYVKIDLNTEQATFKKIPYISNVRNIRANTEYGFIDDGENQWPYKNGFFDFKTEKYIDLKFNNKVINIYGAHCSGNIILIQELKEGIKSYYLFNSASNEIQKIDIDPIDLFNIISLKDGSFFLERILTKDIYKLQSNGTLEKIFELPLSSYYEINEQYGLENSIKALLYHNGFDLYLLSLSENESQLASIPYVNPNASFEFFWRIFDKIFIAQTIVDNEKLTYLWTVGETPQMILKTGKEWNLKNAVKYNGDMMLFYENKHTNSVSIKHFNVSTKEFIFTKDLEGILPYTYGGVKNIIKYSENNFCINLYTKDVGSELWSYNAENGSLEFVKDIYNGHIGSNPSQFLHLQNNIFFTALSSDRSLQWYTVEALINSTFDENQNIGRLEIYPNPVIDHFIIDRDLYNIRVFDTKGNLVFDQYHMEHGKENSFTLNNGLYFIVGYDKAGRMFSKKLIKQE